jgi:hypothetical protein
MSLKKKIVMIKRGIYNKVSEKKIKNKNMNLKMTNKIYYSFLK